MGTTGRAADRSSERRHGAASQRVSADATDAVPDAVPGSVPGPGTGRRTADPDGDPHVEVRRSRRRRRTVTAYREQGRVVVAIPARFTPAEERAWVATMLERLAAQERRRRPPDRQLAARAAELSERYLGGRARPTSVRWAGNQHARWGSCTPADGTIRLSTRLRGVPPWVLDYVLLHELAHLIEPGHGPRFWALLEPYPRTERARGWLDGYAMGRDLPRLADADAGT